ncbi:MAG: DNA adenine methylase [Candidatus Cloacimonadaceae bacterium]|nr:DNA adenine methylase [Candidatus Cloacimonadaceae bacterium]MDP3113460.1 DNA adenine methylase [Candidatus Cloacimonadaceae bacterium]
MKPSTKIAEETYYQALITDDYVYDIPFTESIKYIGSKLNLIPQIYNIVYPLKPMVIFDGFSGSTRVSQAFARLGYKVISNDVATWSKILAKCYLKAEETHSYYNEILRELNSLESKKGWFSEHYGGYDNDGSAIHADGLKKPFQMHNTMKLDAIRERIDALKLSEVDKAVAITSLLLALDSVDSTVGHFSSYLSRWSARSYNALTLKVPALIRSGISHDIYQQDVFSVIPSVNCDLAYFDPPYGSNNEKMPPSRVRYSAYYHLWTTVCNNDQPDIFGKAMRRKDSSDTVNPSLFEEFRKDTAGVYIAVNAIEKLTQRTRAHYILLSYSSGGRATFEALHEVISRNGKLIRVESINYKKTVMANMTWTNDWVEQDTSDHHEYLFLIEK